MASIKNKIARSKERKARIKEMNKNLNTFSKQRPIPQRHNPSVVGMILAAMRDSEKASKDASIWIHKFGK